MRQRQKFIWETDRGELIAPEDMATEHLFYAVRMLFNHTYPPAFRIGEFKRHRNVFKWPLDYREQALLALAIELRGRRLEEFMRDELSDMQRNAEFLATIPDEKKIPGTPWLG